MCQMARNACHLIYTGRRGPDAERTAPTQMSAIGQGAGPPLGLGVIKRLIRLLGQGLPPLVRRRDEVAEADADREPLCHPGGRMGDLQRFQPLVDLLRQPLRLSRLR